MKIRCAAGTIMDTANIRRILTVSGFPRMVGAKEDSWCMPAQVSFSSFSVCVLSILEMCLSSNQCIWLEVCIKLCLIEVQGVSCLPSGFCKGLRAFSILFCSSLVFHWYPPLEGPLFVTLFRVYWAICKWGPVCIIV